MSKVVRRLFPTRPALGLTLLAVILCEGVALADYLVRESPAFMGGFTQPYSGGPNLCLYTRNPDTCGPSGSDPTVNCWFMQNGHHKNWWATRPPGGTCPSTPSHYYNDGQWVSGASEK